jgi:hypothetical protein
MPARTTKRIKKKVKPPTEQNDGDLYARANMEILRNKLYQQTRQRLMGDLFNY